MKKSKKIILISFLTIFVIFGLAFVAIAIKNYKRVSLPLGLNDLGQTEKKDSDHTSKDTQAGIKKNVDDSSSIVTFESEDTKNQFLKENNLKNEQLKNIQNTQSYYLPLAIKQIKEVEGASLNENKIYRALATPNDPLFSSQWHLSKISAPGAWDVTTGSDSTKVAILDTGFALNHQDLSSKFDSTNAWDFVHNDNSPMVGTDNWNGQFVYHGTMMAGLVGAATNNGVGIASIGWNVRVLPVQVLDDNGYGDTYTVASAINYAVSKGAKVISLSLGVPDPDSVVRSAIANATNNGVVVVAAAGNSNCNCIIYPANYPEVIAVGASDSNDNRASFSNYGPNLDVVAPGVGTIRTTYVSQSNQTSSYTTSAYGTSISTPIVAGLAGLIKSARPGVSSSEVENYIRNGADKVSAMNGQNFTYEYGYGRINAYNSALLAHRDMTNWRFETLDGSSDSVSQNNSNVGITPSSIVFNNTLHEFYYDSTNGNLKHAWADSAGWHFDFLDGAGGANGRLNAKVGHGSSISQYGGAMHLFYYDYDGGNLRHAWSDGGGNNWSFETLDGMGGANGKIDGNVGQVPSAAVYDNALHTFYYDVTNGNLRHAWLDGTGWHFENLDGDPGAIGKWNSNIGYDPVALSFGSTLQVFYYDIQYGNLRHAWLDGTGWHFENLDGDPGSISRSNSNTGMHPASINLNGSLQLYYYDAQYGNLRHAWTSSSGWHFENLDGDPGSISRSNSNTGMNPSLTIYNGSLQLYYYDAQYGNLRHAWTSSSGWHFENLDGDPGSIAANSGNVGSESTVNIFNGDIQLYYLDNGNLDLRHAWFLTNP